MTIDILQGWKIGFLDVRFIKVFFEKSKIPMKDDTVAEN